VSTPPDEFSDEQSTQSTEEESQEPEQPSPDEQSTTETQDEEQPSPPSPQERTLPPEAQGETHGGPLGCCLGAVAGIFLMALLTTGIPLLLSTRGLPGTIALPLSLVAAIPCGFIGWQIGKRIYREYELSPRQKQKLAAWENRRAEQRARKRQR
jgi:hypothetical protein